MRSLRLIYCVLAASALTSSLATAAVVELRPIATAVLNEDFSAVGEEFFVGERKLRPRAEPYLIQVDVSMRIFDLQPGQVGFSNTAFNMAVEGDGTAYFNPAWGLPKWNPDNPPDLNGMCGPCPVRNLWDINDDAGPDGNDLQAIILAGVTNFGPPQSDRRRTLGQGAGGDYAGSVFVELPGTRGAWTFAETSTPWGASTYDETGFSTTDGNTAIGGRTATFVVVPEPSTIALLATGVLVELMLAFLSAGKRAKELRKINLPASSPFAPRKEALSRSERRHCCATP